MRTDIVHSTVDDAPSMLKGWRKFWLSLIGQTAIPGIMFSLQGVNYSNGKGLQHDGLVSMQT